mmetsp:Transcript_37430/g.105650  ORF Transcript_37430/g.105650 Transcript_37430/m.105650 type:complete len:313 (-) Transcript_37430:626-1564(-)
MRNLPADPTGLGAARQHEVRVSLALPGFHPGVAPASPVIACLTRCYPLLFPYLLVDVVRQLHGLKACIKKELRQLAALEMELTQRLVQRRDGGSSIKVLQLVHDGALIRQLPGVGWSWEQPLQPASLRCRCCLPRRALERVKVGKPVFVEVVAIANVELYSIMHYRGESCGMILRVQHHCLIRDVPHIGFGTSKRIAVHLADPGLPTGPNVHVPCVLPRLWVLPYPLSVLQPQGRHPLEVSECHGLHTSGLVTAAPSGPTQAVVARSDLRYVPQSEIVADPLEVPVLGGHCSAGQHPQIPRQKRAEDDHVAV